MKLECKTVGDSIYIHDLHDADDRNLAQFETLSDGIEAIRLVKTLCPYLFRIVGITDDTAAFPPFLSHLIKQNEQPSIRYRSVRKTWHCGLLTISCGYALWSWGLGVSVEGSGLDDIEVTIKLLCGFFEITWYQER